MPNYKNSLEDIREHWLSCTRCDLGVRREAQGNPIVFGTGTTRGILFVGEGPGWMEERDGAPFIGQSGTLLRQVLAKIGNPPAYFTNAVICRSCAPVLDPVTQQPVLKQRYGSKVPLPVFKDEPPIPAYMEACRERLYEEIYAVDPILIVSLGGKAAEQLTGRPFSVLTQRGNELEITIPGAMPVPTLTEKRQQWYRGGKAGALTAARPIAQNGVRYTMVPTLHPSYVLRKIADKGPSSPFNQFVSDLKFVARIYDRYYAEVHGDTATAEPESIDDVVSTMRAEMEETELENDYDAYP